MSRSLLLTALLFLVVPAAAFATSTLTAVLGPTGDPDSYGSATIVIDNSNVMTATVEIFNVVPSRCHASHIHFNTCAAGGGIFIGLLDICTDATGHGTAQTVVQLTQAQTDALLASPHYVNVHHPDTFAGITCGDLSVVPTPVVPGSWGRIKAIYY